MLLGRYSLNGLRVFHLDVIPAEKTIAVCKKALNLS